DAVAAENLLKPADVFSSAVKSNLMLRLRLDLIPDALKQKAVEELSKSPEDVPEAQSEALKKLAKEFADSLQMAARDGQQCKMGVEFDRKSGELTVVTELAPKPGTALAREYRQAKPTTSRFAEFAKDAAVFISQTAAVPLAPFAEDLSKPAQELQKSL